MSAHELHALKKTLSGRVTSKSKAECDCYRWFVELIRTEQSNPRTKAAYKAEAVGKFSISERAFIYRIWPAVAEKHGLSKSGRPKRPKPDNG